AQPRRGQAPLYLAVLPKALGPAQLAAWAPFAAPVASDAALRVAARAQLFAEVILVAGSILTAPRLERRVAGVGRAGRARACRAAAAPLLPRSAVSPCLCALHGLVQSRSNGLDVVGDPIPAPFIGVDPLSVLIWTPLGRHPVRRPDFAEAWMR